MSRNEAKIQFLQATPYKRLVALVILIPASIPGIIMKKGYYDADDDVQSVDLLRSDSSSEDKNEEEDLDEYRDVRGVGHTNDVNDDIDDDETVDPTVSLSLVDVGVGGERCTPVGQANPSVRKSTHVQRESTSGRGCQTHRKSPATRTLDALEQSQQSVDLHYDFSQLEYDVVAALVQTKKTKVVLSDAEDDDEEDLEHSRQQLEKVRMSLEEANRRHIASQGYKSSSVAFKNSTNALQRVKPKTTKRSVTNRVRISIGAANSNHFNGSKGQDDRSKRVRSKNVKSTANASVSATPLPIVASNKSIDSSTAAQIKKGPARLKATPDSVRTNTDQSKSSRRSLPTSRRTGIVPAAAMAIPPVSTTNTAGVNGKRGRLPESDRRDIRQIAVKTGRTVNTYASFSEAGKAVGFSRHIVASILRGTYKANSYKGWTFRFVDDDDDNGSEKNVAAHKMKLLSNSKRHEETDTDDDIDLEEDQDNENEDSEQDMEEKNSADPPLTEWYALHDTRRRKTYNLIEHIDLATGKAVATFPSFVVAAEHTGVSRQKISAMVKGEIESFDGSTFRYEKEPEDLDRKLSVKDPEDSAVVISVSKPTSRIRTGRRSVEEDELAATRETAPPTERARSSKAAISVEELDAETGVVLHTYRSLTLASEHSGANRHIISNVLKGRLDSWKGKRWRYATDEIQHENNSQISEDDHDGLGLNEKNSESDHANDDDGVSGKRRRVESDSTEPGQVKSDTAVANESYDDFHTENSAKKARRVSDDPMLPMKVDVDVVDAVVSSGSKTSAHMTSSNCTHAMNTNDSRPCSIETKPLYVNTSSVMDLGHESTVLPSPYQTVPVETVTTPHLSDEMPESKTFEPLVHQDNLDSLRDVSQDVVIQIGFREYEVQNVTLAGTGSLGIVATKTRATDSLLTFLRANYFLETANIGALQLCVGEIERTGIACAAGIEKGDFLLYPKYDAIESIRVLHAEYNVVVDALKNEVRPSLFLIAREKPTASLATAAAAGSRVELKNLAAIPSSTSSFSSEIAHPTSSRDENARRCEGTTPIANSHVAIKDLELTNINQVVNMPSDQLNPPIAPGVTIISTQSLNDVVVVKKAKVVPFCLLCNGCTSRPVHHAWCPLNKYFSHSGADEILDKIRRGVKLDCIVCTKEYETGRPFRGGKHSKACSRHTFKKRTEIRSKAVAKTIRSIDPKRKRLESQLGLVVEESARMDCISIVEDEDGDSVFVDPSQSRRPFQRLLLATTGEINSSVIPCNSSMIPKPGRKPKQKTQITGPVDVPRSSDVLFKPRDCGLQVPVESQVRDVTADSIAAVEEDESNEKPCVTWEVCENVWGPHGHIENDEVVFAPRELFRHHEDFAYERYEIDPFAASSHYCTTYSSPEDGYQALVLRRDALAVLPWGFSCLRDKHGGACLVASVAPFSPARAATFLGAEVDETRITTLHQNDMIVAVNGVSVGGMTRAELEISLEIAGPEIVVLVSRYKFADDIGSGSLEVEYPSMMGSGSVPNANLFPICTDVVVTSEQTTRSESTFDLKSTCIDENTAAGVVKQVSSSNSVRSNGSSGECDQSRELFFSIDDRKTISSGTNTGEESDHDGDTDDGNAWCGCVCGRNHTRSGNHVEVFWIQCDLCFTWYDCSSHCLGFKECQAESMDWKCLACEEVEGPTESNLLRLNSETHRTGRVSTSPTMTQSHWAAETEDDPEPQLINIDSLHADCETPDSINNCSATVDVFLEGEYVLVEEHAWPGVNNPGGIAKILKVYTDDDGDDVYDIRYVIGDKKKAVLPEYLSHHSFS